MPAYPFQILNTKGEPIQGGALCINEITTGYNHCTPLSNADGWYHIYDQGEGLTAYMIKIEVPGYKTVSFPAQDIAGIDQIVLEKSGIKAWQIALIVAGVLLYKKKHNKVGKLSTQDLLPIGLIVGGIIGFDIIKKVLEGLGLWDSAATKNLDALSSDPGSFWNPNYVWTIKPPTKEWTYAISEATAKEWANEIYDAIGMFDDCESCVIAVFKRCRTQANASFLCWVFQRYYGNDLLSWLRGGVWPKDRLSDADVYAITNYISRLPKY